MKRKELILYGENWDIIVIIQFYFVCFGQHVTVVFTQYFRIDGWPIDLTCHLISTSHSYPLSSFYFDLHRSPCIYEFMYAPFLTLHVHLHVTNKFLPVEMLN